MYIIGIDYGHGETSAAVIEIDEELYKTIELLEEEDYSAPEVDSQSLQDKNGTSESLSATTANLPTSLEQTSMTTDSEGEKVVDANREWDIKTIRSLLDNSFKSVIDLNIKGGTQKIYSVLVYDWKKGRWEIGPNVQKLKNCVSNLDIENGQYARTAAYFKAPLVSGKGKKNGSNDLKEIKPEDKISYKLFIKETFNKIIESNNIIHEDPRNYRLYVACPSEWDVDQVNEYKNFLNENGLHCEEVVQESGAAYMSFRDTILGKSINDKELPGVLVIDFGSSTIDFTYFGGEKTINDGYQDGAHMVEEKIVDYLLSDDYEPSPKAAFNKLTAALNGDENIAKALLVFATRLKKEEFYTILAEDGEATFDDILIKNLVIPAPGTGIEFTGADAFGFEYGGGCDQEKMSTILSDYVAKVESDFIDFKNQVGKGSINHVILTGGASNMQFVGKLAENIYKVHKCTQEEKEKGMKDTLHFDLQPSFSISRGIAKYGTYRTLSEPIRKAIEDRLSATWRNEEWLNSELKSLTYSVASEVYYSYFCSIVDEWVKVYSPIKSEADNNLNELLEGIYNNILKEDPDNELWKNIKLSKEKFKPGKRSIHALLRKLYDDIELKDREKKDRMDSLMIDELTKKVNLQVGPLLKKYISIYFDENEIEINPNLPKFYDIKVIFSKEKKNDLLIKLIENVCANMPEGASQTKKTFNKDRESSWSVHASREGLSPVIKNVLKDFCNEIKPDFDIRAISAACKKSVNKKFAEIKDLCEKEPYYLKV